MFLTAIILTKNESIHLRRCISSINNIFNEIYVIDSFSSDNTLEIAKEYGCIIFQKKWVNYSTQFNYALSKIKTRNPHWILRIDADEYLDNDAINFITNKLQYIDIEYTGVTFNRLMYFMGKPIKHGGMFPIPQLRLFRAGKGLCETRWMDEHIILESGNILNSRSTLIDNNLNYVSWWIEKHNLYSSRETIDFLSHKYPELLSNTSYKLEKSASRKRYLKRIYFSLPSIMRSLIYFLYRYLILFGFLDGRRGLMFHFLQGFWYRFLVDTKIYEIEMYIKKNKVDIKTAIYNVLGFKV